MVVMLPFRVSVSKTKNGRLIIYRRKRGSRMTFAFTLAATAFTALTLIAVWQYAVSNVARYFS